MERSDVGDHLDMIGALKVGIASWDGRSIDNTERLLEFGAEIGTGRVAVANIPTRIHVQFHEVGEPPDVLSAGCLAARQDPKPVQVDWFLALGFQVGVDKGRVTDLIESIACDVLGRIAVQKLKRQLVIVCVPLVTPPSSVYCCPQVCFNDLCRCQKS